MFVQNTWGAGPASQISLTAHLVQCNSTPVVLESTVLFLDLRGWASFIGGSRIFGWVVHMNINEGWGMVNNNRSTHMVTCIQTIG